ncbi:MAG: DUF1428 domain-containing protein, partial [Hyphomicrobiales bacterium]
MSYIDGFVVAVPTAHKEKYIAFAKSFGSYFLEQGALRMMECWGDDVPVGQHTDFHRAVEARDDETVVLSWIEWPDKAARDSAMARMTEAMKTDARFDPVKNPMPFDGKRMSFGG